MLGVKLKASCFFFFLPTETHYISLVGLELIEIHMPLAF